MKMILFFCFLLCIYSAQSQTINAANYEEFVSECLKKSGDSHGRKLALWLPTAFWQHHISTTTNFSPEEEKDFINAIDQYLIFCVVDYKNNPGGQMQFADKATIEQTLLLADSSGHTLAPLSSQDIQPDIRYMVEQMQPYMTNLFGQFGKGMNIFMFPADKVYGQSKLDITKKNKFSLSWSLTTIEWKLPFASVMPALFCPVDNEKMKGNWNFCPEHGTKLK